MKEKIIEILKSSLRTFAYIDPVTGESRSAQESAIPEDQFPKIAAELELLINQEVEKRISERMPSLDDLDARLTEYLVGILDSVDFHEWLRSRLTQKTEGGGE